MGYIIHIRGLEKVLIFIVLTFHHGGKVSDYKGQ